MPELVRIQNQLERALEGEAWHGPALLEILAGFDADFAARRLTPGTHSAWELVLHITTWLDIARERLQGVPSEPAPAQDWPHPGTGEEEWHVALDNLRAAHRRLRDAIAAMSEDQLHSTVPGRSYDNYVLLHGVIQHTLYHAGQLILLKRMLAEGGAGQ